MSKYRVHTISKEFNISNKELIGEIFPKLGMNHITHHSNVLTEDEYKKVLNTVKGKKNNTDNTDKTDNKEKIIENNPNKKVTREFIRARQENKPRRSNTVDTDDRRNTGKSAMDIINNVKGDSGSNSTNPNVKDVNKSTRSMHSNDKSYSDKRDNSYRSDNNYNRGRTGEGGYNRDNRGRTGEGGYNRDNRGRTGEGGYNRDNRGRTGEGGYNRDNRGRTGEGGYNRDKKSGYSNDRNKKTYDKNRPNNTSGNKNYKGKDGRTFNKDGQGNQPRKFDKKQGFGKPAKVEEDFSTLNKELKDRRARRKDDKKNNENRFSDGTKSKKTTGAKTLSQNKVDQSQKKRRKKDKKERLEQQGINKAQSEGIKMFDFITVKELAEKMGISATEIVAKLFALGVMVTVNQEIDFDTASIIAEEYEVTVTKEDIGSLFEDKIAEIINSGTEKVERAPIVTIMGHVDHGKTSLLDYIRRTKVADGESGGITQHIGASEAEIHGKKITFLDTPGHEAFTSLRARGASVTDIVILIVAADDGVMPQTKEAISHAKIAEVPIIVAINKIDKDNANVPKVKQELAEHDILIEEWGGEILCNEISAKNGIGIDELLDNILLISELEGFKASNNTKAYGTVIEAELNKSLGSVATLLVQGGSLNVGDVLVAGHSFGKVRAMTNFLGTRVQSAYPSEAIELMGLSEVPSAGDRFIVVGDEKEARKISDLVKAQEARKSKSMGSNVTLENLFQNIEEGKLKELNLVIKADAQGSVEALRGSFEKISNDEVKIKIVHQGIGGVTESDVLLASTSNAIIIAFNVRPNAAVLNTAHKEKVEIKTYSIIYKAIEDIENAMKGMLDPEIVEETLGEVEIREVFKVPNIGVIGGAIVKSGKVVRNAKIRLIRDSIVIYEGSISSLKRFKDDAKEVLEGFECGIGIENYNDIKVGDIIECYKLTEQERE